MVFSLYSLSLSFAVHCTFWFGLSDCVCSNSSNSSNFVMFFLHNFSRRVASYKFNFYARNHAAQVFFHGLHNFLLISQKIGIQHSFARKDENPSAIKTTTTTTREVRQRQRDCIKYYNFL